MNILMFSNDPALLGEKTSTGDTVSRHRAYGRLVEKLSIIVLTKNKKYSVSHLSDQVASYPTNARSLFTLVPEALSLAKQLFSADHYDLIVCQDPFLTGLAGYLTKKRHPSKLLIDFHGDFWDNPYWLKEKPWRYPLLLLSHFTARRADALRVVSSGLKKKIIRAGLKKKSIEVIPTPVNLENFKTPDPTTVLSIHQQFNGQKILLFTGRLTPEKNLPFLLHCFKKIIHHYPNAVLLLVGDGPDKNKLQSLSQTLHLTDRVQFLGSLHYQQLLNYFHAADIFVLPSRHESFGKVLLEAGASGKPAIASATLGAKEIIIDGQTGFLFPINNGTKFIQKALSLLNDDDLAKRLGTAAYTHIWQKYNYQASIKNVVTYWQKIVNNP